MLICISTYCMLEKVSMQNRSEYTRVYLDCGILLLFTRRRQICQDYALQIWQLNQ